MCISAKKGQERKSILEIIPENCEKHSITDIVMTRYNATRPLPVSPFRNSGLIPH